MAQEARRALEDRLAELLRAGTQGAELDVLTQALARLDDGSWGRCETCGGAIGRDRLRAMPEARQCLQCSRRP
jgi:DnaK suppressor protein